MTDVRALAAKAPKAKLEPFEFRFGELRPEQVEIDVESCGICHSDLSMLNNEWGFSGYPLVPGHEVIGRVSKLGSAAKGLEVGQRVGLGWVSGSCLHCRPCVSGDHNLCVRAESTIVGRYGGFATKVRADWIWANPIPDGVDAGRAGPLMCGGITVFNPIVRNEVKPTDRVGVIGIGGLGHLALKFLNKWGCEVTAFTSSDDKADEARSMGAHHVVNSRRPEALDAVRGAYDFIISTVNVPLDWNRYLGALKPRGRLVMVGAVLEPMQIPAFGLISGEKAVAGSPVGSPSVILDMLDFCARHGIAPTTEHFPMSKANEAIAHLESGKARYRIVLSNDLN